MKNKAGYIKMLSLLNHWIAPRFAGPAGVYPELDAGGNDRKHNKKIPPHC
ncbi:MAG: hypothetical protein L0Y79_08075 [Chlorobi bacterium]|nr:hypothetical protein [Chlorobiota bacterium]MCI0715367.1 hypothetical protein [Chlorobiota bacterium]